MEETETQEREVLEPEVLPPEHKQRGRGNAGADTMRRAQRAFGPILAGAFLDFIDLATMGTPGLLIGAAAGYYIATVYELPLRTRLLLAIAAGYYCMLPFTRFLPLATLMGAYVRFRKAGSPRQPPW